jgi:hypothetical protein
MRNGQNKRMRGRNNRKSQNPLTRVYESNGPDVKIRGTASHIAEKYIQLARDAQGSGDPVAAENYYQHAEHYFRLIAAAQEQFRQTQPFYQQGESRTDGSYDEDDEGVPALGVEPSYGPREPQPYMPREAQPYPPREPQPFLPREQQPNFPRQQQPAMAQPEESSEVERLPSFITGGQQPQGFAGNGHDGGGNPPDRFPLHRRRRRHRGPRSEGAGQGSDDSPARSNND